MEYIFVYGFIFILVAAAFSSVWVYYRKTKNINDAEEASAMLAKTANAIYGLGTGSKKKVIVSFPSNVEDIIVQNNEITFVLNDNGKLKNYTAYSNAPLVKGDIAINTRVDGGLPTTGMGYTQAPRRLEISVQKLCNGSVMIGTGIDNCGGSEPPPSLGDVILRTNGTKVGGEDYLNYSIKYTWIAVDADGDGDLDPYKWEKIKTGITQSHPDCDPGGFCPTAGSDCVLLVTREGFNLSIYAPGFDMYFPRICDINNQVITFFELDESYPNVETSNQSVQQYADNDQETYAP